MHEVVREKGECVSAPLPSVSRAYSSVGASQVPPTRILSMHVAFASRKSGRAGAKTAREYCEFEPLFSFLALPSPFLAVFMRSNPRVTLSQGKYGSRVAECEGRKGTRLCPANENRHLGPRPSDWYCACPLSIVPATMSTRDRVLRDEVQVPGVRGVRPNALPAACLGSGTRSLV